MSSVANVLQLKNEYTMDLINKTDYLFYQGIKSIYDSTSLINKEVKMLLREFQIELEKVSTWNDVMLEKEYERFVKSTNCDWLDELIVASFKSSAHIMLSTIGNDASFTNTKMNVEIPTGKRFIHNCYISICRRIWKKPQLMYDKLPKSELIRNEEEVTQMISESIRDTIRCNLPIKQVVSSYVKNDDVDISQNGSTSDPSDDVLSSQLDLKNEATVPVEVADIVETGESNIPVLSNESNVVKSNINFHETNNAHTTESTVLLPTENTHQMTEDSDASSTSNELTNNLTQNRSSSVLAPPSKAINSDYVKEFLASEDTEQKQPTTTTTTAQISDNIDVPPIVVTDGGHEVPQEDEHGALPPVSFVEKNNVTVEVENNDMNIDSTHDSSSSSESEEDHKVCNESVTPRYGPLQNDPNSNGIADKNDVVNINPNHEMTDSSLSNMEKEAKLCPLESNKNANTREVFITSNSAYDDELITDGGYEEDDDLDDDDDDVDVYVDNDNHDDTNVYEDVQHGGDKHNILPAAMPKESWSIDMNVTEGLPSDDKSININKSVKNVYIHEKKKKNEKKIRNVLGLDMEYDKFKTNQKGILKHLLIKTNNQIGVM